MQQHPPRQRLSSNADAFTKASNIRVIGQCVTGGWFRKASSVRKGKGPAFNSTLRPILLVKNVHVADDPLGRAQ